MRENTLTTDDLILPIGSQCQNWLASGLG
jgi:hypothetical protein